jgi:hypothetical protein
LKKLGASQGSQPTGGKPIDGPESLPTPRSLERLGPNARKQIEDGAAVLVSTIKKTMKEIGTDDPSRAVGLHPSQQGGLLKALVIEALSNIAPQQVNSRLLTDMQFSGMNKDEDGKPIYGAGIAVVLEDAASSVEEIVDSIQELETSLEAMIDYAPVNDSEDTERDPSETPNRVSKNDPAIQNFSTDRSKAASGEIVDAGEDRRRNIKDANEGVKEILEFLSSGSITQDQRSGLWGTTVDASTKLPDEGKLKGGVVSAEQLQVAFEMAVEALDRKSVV